MSLELSFFEPIFEPILTYFELIWAYFLMDGFAEVFEEFCEAVWHEFVQEVASFGAESSEVWSVVACLPG